MYNTGLVTHIYFHTFLLSFVFLFKKKQTREKQHVDTDFFSNSFVVHTEHLYGTDMLLFVCLLKQENLSC